MSDNSWVREWVLDIKDAWQYRRPGLEMPAAIYDTIQNAYRSDLKPLILKREKLDNGWWFLIHLPPATPYLEFKKKESLFAESFGGQVFIERKGKEVSMTAYDTAFGEYPFAKHVKPDMYNGMLLPLHFGYSARGPVIYDLAKLQGILIGGNRGMGKSNLVITLATNLLLYSDALVGIIDYLTVDTLQFEPYAAYADTNEKALSLVKAIASECEKRKALFAQHRANNLEKMRNKGFNIKPIVLFVDELSEVQDKDVLAYINHLLRTGRKFGFYMVGATQRPSSTNVKNNWGDSKMLLPTRVCFSVPDVVNSQIILDNDKGASIDPHSVGRCIFQFKDSLEVQCLKLEPEEAEDLLQGVRQEVMQFHEELPKMLPTRQQLSSRNRTP